MTHVAKLIAAGLLGTVVVSAAQPAAAQMTLGFKLGPTFSTLSSSDETEEAKTLTSFGGGGFIRFGVGGFALQPEVLVLTKGAKVEDPEGTAKIKLDYVEIPVLAAFTFGQGTIAPYILAGPSFAFEIGCKIDFESQGTSIESECEDESGGDSRKKFDLGLTGAAGLTMRLGPGSVLIEGRYTHGLTNINDEDVTSDTLRNRMYAFFAGYSIPLGTR